MLENALARKHLCCLSEKKNLNYPADAPISTAADGNLMEFL